MAQSWPRCICKPLYWTFLPEQPSSSDWSSQSSSLSHVYVFGMQFPFAHANSPSAHVTSKHNGALLTRELPKIRRQMSLGTYL